jgi:hypothetical protein
MFPHISYILIYIDILFYIDMICTYLYFVYWCVRCTETAVAQVVVVEALPLLTLSTVGPPIRQLAFEKQLGGVEIEVHTDAALMCACAVVCARARPKLSEWNGMECTSAGAECERAADRMDELARAGGGRQ